MKPHRVRMTGLGWLVLMLLVVWGQAQPPAVSTAMASAPTSDAPTAAAPAPALSVLRALPGKDEPAAVVVANRTVAVLRAEWNGYSPASRANSAMDRIRQVVELNITGPVRAERIGESYRILIKDRPVFHIYDADVDLLAEETTAQVGAETVRKLQEALTAIQEQRRPAVILQGVLWALLSTVILGILVWLCLRIHHRLRSSLGQLAQGRLKDLDAETVRMLTRPFRMILKGVTRLALVFAVVFLVYVWITSILSHFPLTRPWGDGLRHSALGVITTVGSGILSALPGLGIVAIALFIAWGLSRGVRLFFAVVEQRQVCIPWLNLYPDTATPMRRLTLIALWGFTVVLIYPYLPGSETEVFKALGIFFGVVISLGSSGLVSQLISGFILIFSRFFSVGDYVRVGEVEGTVKSIGAVSTKVHTIRREEVNIPNNVLLNGTSLNFSRLAGDHGVAVHSSVTIGYDTPWRQIHAMLRTAADRTAGLKKEPAPFVIQTALGDFYVEYQVNAYLEEADQRVFVLAELHANIQDAFNENGVQIMSPHYRTDPPVPKVVPKSDWHIPPAPPAGEERHPRLLKDSL